MIRKLFTSCIFSMLVYSCMAQTPSGFGWAKKAGSTSTTDLGYSITSDKDSNVIVSGYFKGTCDFGGQSLISNGFKDGFTAKYDAKGALIWAKKIGGFANDEAKSVTSDNAGNIFVVGNFLNDMPIENNDTLFNKGSFDCFLVKYNSSGSLQWGLDIGSASSDAAECVSTDKDGNVIVIGTFQGTMDLGNGNTITTSGGNDIYLVKVNTSGTVIWLKKAGGTLSDAGLGLSTDLLGNIFISGNFSGTAKFDNISLVTSGNIDVFIAKYDMNGTALWAKKGSSGTSNNEYGFGINSDRFGNCYVVGYFEGTTLTFGTTSLSNGGNWDMFLVKFNGAGTVKWAKKFGGSGWDYAYAVATDYNGNVLITGGFGGTVNFGSNSLTSTNSGTEDLFVLKLDSNGTSQWAIKAGSSASSNDYVWGEGITIDKLGNVLVTGTFEGSPSFSPFNLTSSGGDEQYGEDVFIAKIYQNVPWVESISISTSSNSVSCKGGNNGIASVIANSGTPPFSYSWSNSTSTSTITGLVAGNYTVTVTDNLNKTATASVNVSEPQIISITTSVVNVKCFGDASGSVNLTLSGGNPGYTFSWSNSQSSQNLTSLTASIYTVTTTDTKGCTSSKSISIAQPTALLLSAVITSSTTPSPSCNGAINLEVTGGTPNYTYLWGNASNLQDQINLCNGNHSVSITDGNGCKTDTVFSLVTDIKPDIFSIIDQDVQILNRSGNISISINKNPDFFPVNLECYMLDGRKIFSYKITSSGTFAIPLFKLNSGIYVVRIYNSGESQFLKVFME